MTFSIADYIESCYHLSAMAIAGHLYLPTHPAIRQKRNTSGQLVMRDIFGISARKVYPDFALQRHPVSSYLTFSPSSALADSYFLWHCLVLHVYGKVPPLAGYVALCCPDFP